MLVCSFRLLTLLADKLLSLRRACNDLLHPANRDGCRQYLRRIYGRQSQRQTHTHGNRREILSQPCLFVLCASLGFAADADLDIVDKRLELLEKKRIEDQEELTRVVLHLAVRLEAQARTLLIEKLDPKGLCGHFYT